MVGTLINVGTVAAGSLLGMGLNARLPERFTQIVFQVLGLFTLLMGVHMALGSGNMLVLVLGTLIGAIIGEACKLEDRANRLAEKLGAARSPDDAGKFAQGLVTAFMLFCIGALTVLGCFQEGLEGDNRLIITKAIMDFFSSTALAAAFGKGVLFSVVPLLVYQGGLTLLAGVLKPILSDPMITELSASGGLMLMGLGINILDIRHIRVVNMLPALITTAALTALAQYFGWYAILG